MDDTSHADRDADSGSETPTTSPDPEQAADPETGQGTEQRGEPKPLDGTIGTVDDDAVAKVYYEEGEPVVLAAAFVIEDWPWVIGFDQLGTEGYDYVSIPSERVVGVMSRRYTSFSHNGRRVTAYGVMDEEVREFRDLLPL
ncbi:hypothetical protein Hbl1158_13385 [Halobaculum sp. CBA1158]|uniref:hypothetical protein n=1 Tax=Halobaculum sp. CBA1158 TaxID=2904243 RepID=UPI001F1764F4|nr:hypothetical protein [Halobaculum sp. CBA1158]UIO99503.1 hypothetical protein Hbl1158_13385 [Halobaculum sp. CBA1158]